MSEALRVEVEGRVAVVTMNRPETKNALDQALVGALARAFVELGERRDVGCIVLTGAGEAFCSGADLKSAMADPNAISELDQRLEGFQEIVRAVVSTPQPVIAAVDGPAVGFGCDLALACDLRVLSERAYLQEKFVRIGLMPDGGGTLWLPQMIGVGRALELMLTGEAVDAPRALALGLANRVVPAAELLDATRQLAGRIAKGPPLAHAGIKRAVRASLAAVESALANEKEGQLRCLRSSDFLEGTMAWMQKREPSFRGE